MTGCGKASQKAARGARLKAALRENLKRRKAQARRRTSQAAADSEGPASAAKAERSKGVAPDFRRNPGRD
jgi:hypothetical protein